MVVPMLACPSNSLTVTMSIPSRVSLEAKVCLNMCQGIFGRPARLNAAAIAPLTSLNEPMGPVLDGGACLEHGQSGSPKACGRINVV